MQRKCAFGKMRRIGAGGEPGPAGVSRRHPVEVVAAVVLTTLFGAALAVIFGVTALRDARTR